jgi:hypothetical protein
MFVPGRRVNAFDLLESHGAHSSVVVPDVVLSAFDGDLVSDLRPRSHDIYLLNGLNSTPAGVLAVLERFASALATNHLSGAPLGALR